VTFNHVYCKKDDKYYKLGFEKRNGKIIRYLNVYENTYTPNALFNYNEFDSALIVTFERVYKGSESDLSRWAEKTIRARTFLNNFDEVVTEIYKQVADMSKNKLEKRMKQLDTISKATETDSKPPKTYKIVIEVVEG
jgi:triacylglycerol esterase/lipase EstA (alpha/beta hydrolase family)